MTGLIRTTEPASRGRVRCDNCHRPIARGVHYTRDTLADGGDIWDWRACPACADVYRRVAAYVGPWAIEEEGLGPADFADWADDAMGVSHRDRAITWWISIDPARSDCLDTSPEGDRSRTRSFLTQLTRADAFTRAADADPNQAWDDEAWAAFTWRMRTSTALHPEGITA